MPKIEVEGLQVDFPFTPYQIQEDAMRTIIKALKAQENALIESPTGTGKGLTLLCATLAYASLHKKRVYMASRTHSQLSQLVKEFKASAYAQQVKFTILGSREQLCINDQVLAHSKGGPVGGRCKATVGMKQCGYYNNTQASQSSLVMDIEDLKLYGKETQQCPYYLTKEVQKRAELIVLPYNYIIDSNQRSLMQIELVDSIVIFDEAHNLESACNEATSFDLSDYTLQLACNEANDAVVLAASDMSAKLDLDKLQLVKRVIQQFQQIVGQIKLHPPAMDFNADGEYAKQLFIAAGVDNMTFLDQLQVMQDAIQYLERHNKKVVNLSAWCDAVRKMFSTTDLVKCYKMYVHKDKSSQSWILSFWCFSAHVALKQMSGVRSFILASGTLSPLASFACELGIPFKHQLENPHVVDADQMVVNVLTRGPSGTGLNSSYGNRNDLSYIKDLGNAIVNFSRIVPEGVLVFFPSYVVMDMCVKEWNVCSVGGRSVMQRIAVYKQTYVEPKDKMDFNKEIGSYYKLINDEKGALLMAVCRGKASEGIDFSDGRARAVIITGLPYPSSKDPKVVLKQQFLDQQVRESRGVSNDQISGKEWYGQQATRAVNQALGRVIRHRNDWGAILLCDERFASQKSIKQLPKWLRLNCIVQSSFGECLGSLSKFVRARQAHDLEQGYNTKPLLPIPEPSTNTISLGLPPIVKQSHLVLRNKENSSFKGIVQQVTQAPVQISQPVTAAQKPITRPTQANVQAQSKVYMQKLRSTLPSELYTKFKSIVGSYSSNSIKYTEMVTELSLIFDCEAFYQLFAPLQYYVPSRHKQEFLEYCQQVEAKYQVQLPEVNPQELCIICNKRANSPFKSRCEHMACHDCWFKQYKKDRKCPDCQMPFTLSSLNKIYFV